MNERMQTTEAHQALMKKLDETERQFATRLPPDQRLAIVAQFIGQLIAELPDEYDPASVMASVSANMVAGNKQVAAGRDRGKVLT